MKHLENTLPVNRSLSPLVGNRAGILLKVMAGEKFDTRVSSWYGTNGVSLGGPIDSLIDVVAALIAGIVGGGNFSVPELQTNTVSGPDTTEFFNDRSYYSSRPKAYLNWILFDEHGIRQCQQRV